MKEQKRYYVYLHKDETGMIRYVGKGCKNRAYNKQGRTKYWKRIFQKHQLNVEIAINNLNEDDAFELETFLYDIFLADGHKLCNLERPESRKTKGFGGRKHTENTKKILSEKSKNRVLTDVSKEKISISNIGKHPWTLEKAKKISETKRKLKKEEIKEIRKLLKNGIKGKDLALKYNVSEKVISHIKNNIGYII